MAVFFQMRACDEWKDAEDDRRYRPNRPIPRGLVKQSTILKLGAATMPFAAAAAAWLWHPPVLWLLLLVWVWLSAMTVEFGAPAWLKARPVLYLVSHMAIMPLLDLLLTSVEWLPGGGAPDGLWLFLALSFVNGCVIEIGRKLWAPENEIEGVDSYSRLWGPKTAAIVWIACVALSFVLLVAVGFATGVGWITALLASLALAGCAQSARSYVASPRQRAQDRMDMVSQAFGFSSVTRQPGFCHTLSRFSYEFRCFTGRCA